MIMVAKKFTLPPKRVTFAVSDASEFKRELIDFGVGPETARPLVCARDSAQRRYTLSGEFRFKTMLLYSLDYVSYNCFYTADDKDYVYNYCIPKFIECSSREKKGFI